MCYKYLSLGSSDALSKTKRERRCLHGSSAPGEGPSAAPDGGLCAYLSESYLLIIS